MRWVCSIVLPIGEEAEMSAMYGFSQSRSGAIDDLRPPEYHFHLAATMISVLLAVASTSTVLMLIAQA
jgi:hypothetical protein